MGNLIYSIGPEDENPSGLDDEIFEDDIDDLFDDEDEFEETDWRDGELGMIDGV